MDKIAQERGLLNKLREKTNISGMFLEGLVGEVQEMMDKLRATDDKIRTHAESVKSAVRSAKSYNNRRDYISAATNISAFHERCRWISAELDKFVKNLDLKHYRFVLDNADDEQKEQLFGYDPEREIDVDFGQADDIDLNSQIITAALKKQAGISDWWFKATDPLADIAHNLTSSRGIAMRAYENRFSVAFMKELKTDTGLMVNSSQKFLQELLSVFKDLAHARAKRKLAQYVRSAKIFISKFANYHIKFVKYYKKDIVPLKLEHQKMIDEKKKEVDDKAKGDIDTMKHRQDPDAPPFAESPVKVQPQPPTISPGQGFQPRVQNPPQPGPATINRPKSEPSSKDVLDRLDYEQEQEKPFNLTKKKSNDFYPFSWDEKQSQFISKIEKIADADDPKSLMLEILSYSNEIEDYDPNISLKLLAIAEGISEEYKTAGVFDFLKKKEPEVKQEEKQETKPEPITPPAPESIPPDLTPPETKKAPVRLDLPEGKVNQKYSNIPALAAITPEKIKATLPAIKHMGGLFSRRLYDLNLEPERLDDFFEQNIVNEIRKAIPKGIVLSNHPVVDEFNPKDRQLEIYTYVRLSNIDPNLNGTAKIIVACRLSTYAGTLSIRTINRNFTVE